MSTADHDSSTEFSPDALSDPSCLPGGPERSDIWLDGDVLACTCPDCQAPMSIRLWLMVADCWSCGASLELNDTQQRDSLALLREHERSRRRETRQAAATVMPTMLSSKKPSTIEPQVPAEDLAENPAEDLAEDLAEDPAEDPAETTGVRAADVFRNPSTPPPVPPDSGQHTATREVPHGTRARIRQIYERGAFVMLLLNILKDLPAWLVSMVFHMILMLLLSLWIVELPTPLEEITLSTSVALDDLEGDLGDLEPAEEETFEFEEPGFVEIEELVSVDVPGIADVELEKPEMKSVEPVSMIPDAQDMGMLLTSAPIATGSMFSGRNALARAQKVRTDGGTNQTEAAVNRGLDWLARHQFADGHWSLNAWDQAPGARAKMAGRPDLSDTAGTALALLPFLGAGHTHLDGPYSNNVYRGLKWLIRTQKKDGDLRGDGNGRMYSQGQCAIALCEAYAMTRDSQLREPAQRALDYIIKAQHPAGGWRYSPGKAGDTSVVGWQLMALRSGKMAYLIVPQETFEKTSKYLDSVQGDTLGGRYAYKPKSNSTPTMTAEALLCRQYLGWPRNHPGLKSGAKFLVDEHLPSNAEPNMYYWYYATQVMHHYGGPKWRKWNDRMRDVLVSTQQTKGPLAGSWDPRGGHASRGGRVYMTALAICSLEVYYRHLPMYQEGIIEGITPLQDGPLPEREELAEEPNPPKAPNESVELESDKDLVELEQLLKGK